MTQEESDVTKEVCFLLAKFLRSKFPMISDEFIKICETRDLFPSCVFSQHPSFSDLENWSLSGIPDDQLIRLVELASPKSEFASVLFKKPEPVRPLSLPDSLVYGLSETTGFELEKWAPAKRIIGHTDKIYCVAIDATSQVIITGSDDARVKLWDLRNMSLIGSMTFHTGVITEVCIHPSNAYFATASHDFCIDFCDLVHGELIRKMELPCEVHMIKFSPCGTYLAAALQEGTIRVWTVADIPNGGEETAIIPTLSGRSAAWIDFSRCGEFLLYSGDPDELNVYSLSKQEIIPLRGHAKLPEFAQFSRKSAGTILSLASKDKSLRVWRSGDELWSDELVLTTRGGLNGPPMKFLRAAWNCDESRLVAISNTCLCVWETTNYEMCHRIIDVFTEQSCVLAPHPFLREVVFVGCQSGRSALWDVMAGQLLVPLQLEDTPKISEVKWAPDGSALVVADELWGFTIMQRNMSGFACTVEQFFPSETEDNVDDKTTIVDIHGLALSPQPRRRLLSQMKLEVCPRVASYADHLDEQRLLEKWDLKKHDIVKLRDAVGKKAFQKSILESHEELCPEIPDEPEDAVEEPEPVHESEFETDVLEEELSEDPDITDDYIIYDDSRRAPRESARKKPKFVVDDDSIADDDSFQYSEDGSPPPKRRGRKQTRRKSDIDYDYDFSSLIEEEEPPLPTKRRGRPSKPRVEEPPPKKAEQPKKTVQKAKQTANERVTPSQRKAPKSKEAEDENPYVFFDQSSSDNENTKSVSRYSPPPKARRPMRRSLRLKKQEPVVEEYELHEPPVPEEVQPPAPKHDEKTTIRIPGLKKGTRKEKAVKQKTTPTLPEWMWSHERLRYTYLPQIGEEVVYFRQGHEDNEVDCQCDFFTPPYVKYPKLGQMVFGVVTNVEFYSDHLLISVSFDSRKESLIYWPVPATPNFLVARDFYEMSMNFIGQIVTGTSVSVYFVNDEGVPEPWEAKVVKVAPNWEKKPYNSVTVKWADKKYKEPADLCPWELTFTEAKPRRKPVMVKLMQSFIASVRRMIKNDDYAAFVNLRGNQSAMVVHALKPMDLLLLEQRLESEWYSTIDELIHDIRQLAINAEPLALDQELADSLVVDLLSYLSKYMTRNRIEAPQGFDPKTARVDPTQLKKKRK